MHIPYRTSGRKRQHNSLLPVFLSECFKDGAIESVQYNGLQVVLGNFRDNDFARLVSTVLFLLRASHSSSYNILLFARGELIYDVRVPGIVNIEGVDGTIKIPKLEVQQRGGGGAQSPERKRQGSCSFSRHGKSHCHVLLAGSLRRSYARTWPQMLRCTGFYMIRLRNAKS
jgi:hypothetical protein